MTSTDHASTFTVSLGLSAHAQADQFRRRHGQPAKAKQVYLNTLAAYAVQVYLDSLGIATDLAGSYSQQPAQQVLMDVADLALASGDRLECRPVLPEANDLLIPPEVCRDRAAYVAVQLSADLRQATLLGFVTEPAGGDGAVALSQLLAIESLAALLTSTAPSPAIPVRLGDWLQNTTTAGWQTLAAWGVPNSEWAFRGDSRTGAEPAVQRYRQYQLGQGAEAIGVVLTIGLLPLADAAAEAEIWVRLQPANDRSQLPPALRLRVADAAGAPVMQAEARQAKFLQLKFVVAAGEAFELQLVWQMSEIVELFVF